MKKNRGSSVYARLLSVKEQKGAGYVVLIDPESAPENRLIDTAAECAGSGADFIFVGGSLVSKGSLDTLITGMKQEAGIPVVLFPGSLRQISRTADALLFLSLISGRNPNYLIGEQVLAAPLVRKYGIEAVSTGYILVESGTVTSVEFMSNTKPVPRAKSDIAAAHAMAAEYLGMKTVYLEAGSGALHPVPDAMVQAVSGVVSIPVIVGGGIRTPRTAADKVKNGASFIVTGTVVEDSGTSIIEEFAHAVHSAASGRQT